ncbi:MAG: DUF222 domain-containing protein [Microbacterium sp.]|uniref:HNH endonuclease n=1 Tax=Microbacterium sp. TaxID=51671 RepID=UPI0039E3CF76
MNDPLAGIQQGLEALRAVWGYQPVHDRYVEVDELSAPQTIAAHEGLAALQRQLDAVQARVAAKIARESQRDLGADSLAKQQGFRSPIALVAATTGSSGGDAARLIKVGEATTPRMTLTGERMPAKHPHAAACLDAGSLSTRAASMIITMLDRIAFRCSPADLDAAERTLCEQAPGLALDQLAKVIARAEAHLDPDGVEPREHDLRAETAVHIFERDGLIHLSGKFDPAMGAPVKIAIEGVVTAEFRAATDSAVPGDDSRSVPQRQADALALICSRALADDSGLPAGGATVVVRVSADDLEAGVGSAEIDGIAQPVSVATARRLAADAGIIACVLGGASEILDWGRVKRLFTKAQKLALVERDGGCANCGLPPGMCKVHHLRWWVRDAGPTDLDNGVLLCESCHHRIHDNGWEIRIDGTGTRAKVWFIPPPHVDPARVPRLGGRARFDYVAA